jgi:hypothetical protein
MTRNAFLSWVLAAALGIGAAPSPADDCVDFKWDVAQERALFAGPATALTAGADSKSAPPLQLRHLYELKLLPQDQVSFAVTPGKRSPRGDSYAGLITFKIPATGSYRVSIDMPFWIDVVHDGALVAANDFQGQHGCDSPHKIVMFDLQGARPFILQLSNAAPQSVRLTITATPARKL